MQHSVLGAKNSKHQKTLISKRMYMITQVVSEITFVVKECHYLCLSVH